MIFYDNKRSKNNLLENLEIYTHFKNNTLIKEQDQFKTKMIK